MPPIEILELELTVIRADGLAAKDTNMWGMRTASDPYVEVRLCPWGPLHGHGRKIMVGTTETKLKTLSPVWNQTFQHAIPTAQLSEFAIFELTIMDYDKKTEDDLMGIVPVHIPIAKPSWTTTKWYGVPAASADGDEATGRVQCTLKTKKRMLKPGESLKSLNAKAAEEPEPEKKSSFFSLSTYRKRKEQEQQEADPASGTGATTKIEVVELDLTVLQAKGLAARDKNMFGLKAKSDPYIEIRLWPKGLSEDKGKSRLLGKTPPKMKTLDPTWKNQTFSTTLPKKDLSQFAMFELTIMDYDEDNDDDLMGVVPVPIHVPAGTSDRTTKWYQVPAHSANGEVASGKVECVLGITKGFQDVEAPPSEPAPKVQQESSSDDTKQGTEPQHKETEPTQEEVPTAETETEKSDPAHSSAGDTANGHDVEHDSQGDVKQTEPLPGDHDKNTQSVETSGSVSDKDESSDTQPDNTTQPQASSGSESPRSSTGGQGNDRLATRASMRIDRIHRRIEARASIHGESSLRRSRSIDESAALFRRTATTGGIQRRPQDNLLLSSSDHSRRRRRSTIKRCVSEGEGQVARSLSARKSILGQPRKSLYCSRSLDDDDDEDSEGAAERPKRSLSARKSIVGQPRKSIYCSRSLDDDDEHLEDSSERSKSSRKTRSTSVKRSPGDADNGDRTKSRSRSSSTRRGSRSIPGDSLLGNVERDASHRRSSSLSRKGTTGSASGSPRSLLGDNKEGEVSRRSSSKGRKSIVVDDEEEDPLPKRSSSKGKKSISSKQNGPSPDPADDAKDSPIIKRSSSKGRKNISPDRADDAKENPEAKRSSSKGRQSISTKQNDSSGDDAKESPKAKRSSSKAKGRRSIRSKESSSSQDETDTEGSPATRRPSKSRKGKKQADEEKQSHNGKQMLGSSVERISRDEQESAKLRDSPTSVKQELNPEDVQQQRQKVCDIYSKWNVLKQARSSSLDQKARMTMFTDIGN